MDDLTRFLVSFLKNAGTIGAVPFRAGKVVHQIEGVTSITWYRQGARSSPAGKRRSSTRKTRGGGSDYDLAGIQSKAAEQGIPYQSLISGVIHQFVEGPLATRPWKLSA